MKQSFLTIILFFLCICTGLAQYGNEWIDYSKTYHKFQISQDGIYRITHAVLSSAGLSVVPGAQFRLYHLGNEVPIYTSAQGTFSPSDFIEFYGVKNRGESDRILFEDPDLQQLNPEYSMFTDFSTYFLTWDKSGGGLRFNDIPNDLSNPPAPESYYLHKDQWVHSEHAVDPRTLENETFISFSRMQEAEGFSSSERSSYLLDVPASQIYAQGPDALLNVRLASVNFTDHNITAVFKGETIWSQTDLNGFRLFQISQAIPVSTISTTQLLDIQDSGENSRFVVASVEWVYPRQFDFSGKTYARFSHEASDAAQYFEVNNFEHGGQDPIVYDLRTGQRLPGNISGSTVRFLFPVSTETRDLVIVNPVNGIQTVDALTDVAFTDYAGDNTEYIIITHPSLRTGSDVVGQYADYRRSVTGGGYDVNVYHIDEIIDQFGYGITNHPQAIRNFGKMIKAQWGAAKMVLIVGKGIVFTLTRNPESSAAQNLLVPTFGNPGADNLLFTENGVSRPPFPIGRLPVADQGQLQVYLSKLKEYDEVLALPQTIADRAWTKHIMHLGGGATTSQQGSILNALNLMASNAINSEFGAHVSTFTKSSTELTGQANSDRILSILRDGISLVKFFGHSSASTLDFQINNPRDWNNKGKYPIFSAMGCRAGDIHQNYSSLSENFVFEPNAGPIAFVAGSGSQYENALASWGKDWYDTFGHGVNTMTLGETVLESLGSLNQFGSVSHVLLVEQQTITGDPALRFYATPGPDYVWDYESVTYEPNVLTTNDTAFTLSADVVNIGTNLPDTLFARVMQRYPDGSTQEVFFDTVYLNKFRTRLEFHIPIERRASGLNTFFLTIDPLNQTIELPHPAAEQNNNLTSAAGDNGIEIFILDNRARITYPQEFSIVTEQQPTLIASSTNAFIPGQKYVMEIDSTTLFNSPVKVRELFDEAIGVIKWSPVFTYTPGTVYYWRVSTDSISETQSYIWDTSSFLYQPGGSRGWNQSHYFQFLRDDFDRMLISPERQFEFITGVQNVWVQNAVDTAQFERFNFFVNNQNFISYYRPWKPHEAHVFVVVFDPVTGISMKNPIGGAFGAINPFNQQRPVFPFSTATPESRNALMTFIKDVIPANHYVVLYTYQRTGFTTYYPEQWNDDKDIYGRSIFSVIEDIYPESQIRVLENGSVPYTIMFQKDVGIIQEQIALDYDAVINAEGNFSLKETQGKTNSTLIGPASAWSTVEWAFSEKESHDVIALSVYGLRLDGTETLVVDSTTDVSLDITALNANEFPFLRLQFHSKDTTELRSSAQLEYWRVIFDGLPEYVYNPVAGFAFDHDTLPLGDELYFMTVVENISSYPGEPFKVAYTISDPSNQVTEVLNDVPALAPGGSAIIELFHTITDVAGDHLLLAELNPGSVSPEIHHFNNYGTYQFFVDDDKIIPTLDVTFDGRHLVEGDVVSSQPEIVISILDDNPFLGITEPTAFELSMRTPSMFDLEDIDVTTSAFLFIPSDPKIGVNRAQLIWHPTFVEDGFYTFSANGRDAKGNRPPVGYEINFEILGETRLVNLKVIPNPFGDIARFNFILTGHDAPASLSITITDAVGRMVRILDEEELGTLHVGSHEVEWDGRSEGGALVSPGVYFYQLEVRDVNGRKYDLDRKEGDTGKVIFVR